MDQLVLSELFHKVLFEVIIFIFNLNPVRSELSQFFLLLFADNVLPPNLALIDSILNQFGDFLFESGVLSSSCLAVEQCMILFLGEKEIDFVFVFHVLGVFFELFGLEIVPSKPRREVFKPDKIVNAPRESLLLGAFEDLLCRPGVRIILWIVGVVAHSISSDKSEYFWQLLSKVHSLDSVLKLMFGCPGMLEKHFPILLVILIDSNLLLNIWIIVISMCLCLAISPSLTVIWWHFWRVNVGYEGS